MNEGLFLEGVDRLQMRLIDICRALAENERVFINAIEILKVLAIEDWKFDEGDFEHDCELLSSAVDPIEAYSPMSVGYAYRQMLRMGQPWHSRYPHFDLRGMYGDPHDDFPSGPEYVELRLSKFSHLVMPVGKPPLLPISLLNGVVLPNGTAIPSHPLEELWMAFEHVRQDPNIGLDDLMEILPGPDFASGGVVGGTGAIHSLYENGKETLTLRADIREEIEGGRTRVAIVSLPPGVLIKTVLEQIRALGRNGVIPFYGIKDLSQGEQVRITLDAPRSLSPAALKQILFRETDLERQVSFQCAFSDSSGWRDDDSLISVLKKAVSRCTLSWERKDDEPIDYIPLLRDILEHGGYKSPLTDLIDARKSRILNL
jgi:hypothetical protein